jgi:hypothetical protein
MALSVAGTLAFPWRHLWCVICKHNRIAGCFDFQIRCENSLETYWLRSAGQNKSEYWCSTSNPDANCAP